VAAHLGKGYEKTFKTLLQLFTNIYLLTCVMDFQVSARQSNGTFFALFVISSHKKKTKMFVIHARTHARTHARALSLSFSLSKKYNMDVSKQNI
jgi:hypothetical protein